MLLDHTNPDSVAKNTKRTIGTLTAIRDNMARGAARYNRVSPQSGDAMSLDILTENGSLDVRLVANADGECWFATGDVQYDTTHGAVYKAITLNHNTSDNEVRDLAADLVNGVADQLAEQAE